MSMTARKTCPFCNYIQPLGDDCDIQDANVCRDCEIFYRCARGCKMALDARLPIDNDRAASVVEEGNLTRNHRCHMDDTNATITELIKTMDFVANAMDDFMAKHDVSDAKELKAVVETRSIEKVNESLGVGRCSWWCL